MHSRAVFSLVLFFVFVVSACNSNSAADDGSTNTSLLQTGSTTSTTGNPYTFTNVSNYILQPRCGSCHQFSDYSSVMQQVVAGNPNNSPLYYMVASGRMPKNGTALPANYVRAIGIWINQGAQNN